MSPAEFCRELEAYLCRKNEGHLIRIVGPVFGTVTGWAEQGIPLKVAFRGIDRYFDRHQKRPHQPRRRPVPIQFCEADILDAFDEWRRALGLSATAARSLATPSAENQEERPLDGATLASASSDSAGGPTGSTASTASGRDTRRPGAVGSVGPGADAEARAGHGVERRDSESDADPRAAGADTAAREVVHARRKPGLQLHIDRVMARLTQRRVDVAGGSALGDAIDRILGQLDALRADAKGLRGDARERVVAGLGVLDRVLLDGAAAALDAAALAAVRAEAARELEAFRSRMAPAAFDQAAEAAADRLMRERLRLPTIRVDE
jgi:hypothetical protein